MQNETKRRGRPPKSQDVEPDEHDDRPEVEVEPEAEAKPVPSGPPTPPCHRCGEPLEKSTALLRAYGLACYRCVSCRHVAIEDDTQWFDFATAISGNPPLIVERAAALYAARRREAAPEAFGVDLDDAIFSGAGDLRWSTVNL
jgi:hypothetical protein